MPTERLPVFCAALMAGGRSRRFGSDKAFHSVSTEEGTRPLWAMQLEKLRRTGADHLMLSANADQCFEGLPDDVRLVVDDLADRGPLGGLLTCLGACPESHLLMLAVDLVEMTEEFLSRVVAGAEAGHGVAPFRDGRWEPLAAIYPVEILPLVERRLSGADYSLQGLLMEAGNHGLMRRISVPEEDGRFFRNLNRPG